MVSGNLDSSSFLYWLEKVLSDWGGRGGGTRRTRPLTGSKLGVVAKVERLLDFCVGNHTCFGGYSKGGRGVIYRYDK